MIRLLTSLLALGLVAAAVPDARAQGFVVGPRVGLQLEGDEDLTLGAEARVRLASPGGFGFTLRPSFDYHLTDGVTVLQFGVDSLLGIPIPGPVGLYGVVGLGLSHVRVGGGGTTDLGLDLGAGATFRLGDTLRPFVELRKTLGDFEPLLLTGGLLFAL
jgi:hypothetical protein